MKVKIIDGLDTSNVEDKINDFIKNKEIIDIKYQINSNQGQSCLVGIVIISALIMYKEN